MSDEPSDIQKLLAWLIKRCKTKKTDCLNWSVIYIGCPKPMLKNSKYIKEILEVLENASYVCIEMKGKTKIIRLNPEILV